MGSRCQTGRKPEPGGRSLTANARSAQFIVRGDMAVLFIRRAKAYYAPAECPRQPRNLLKRSPWVRLVAIRTASPASWRRRRDDCQRHIGADQPTDRL